MILDSTDRSALYLRLHPGLEEAFRWLDLQAGAAGAGKHPVTDGVTAIVDTYTTAPAALKKWEAHRLHVDLQVVLSGSELAGWAPVPELATRTPYDPAKDAELFEPPVIPSAMVSLRPGFFAMFFPWDGHQPGVMQTQPSEVRKVVFKLRV